MKPGDFWGLTPQEFWWILEAKRPVKMYLSMPEEEVRYLYEKAYGPLER